MDKGDLSNNATASTQVKEAGYLLYVADKPGAKITVAKEDDRDKNNRNIYQDFILPSVKSMPIVFAFIGAGLIVIPTGVILTRKPQYKHLSKYMLNISFGLQVCAFASFAYHVRKKEKEIGVKKAKTDAVET